MDIVPNTSSSVRMAIHTNIKPFGLNMVPADLNSSMSTLPTEESLDEINNVLREAYIRVLSVFCGDNCYQSDTPGPEKEKTLYSITVLRKII